MVKKWDGGASMNSHMFWYVFLPFFGFGFVVHQNMGPNWSENPLELGQVLPWGWVAGSIEKNVGVFFK